MKCKDCPKRVVFSPKYGDMTKIKRFAICSLNGAKLHLNSQPKWCPYQKEVAQCPNTNT